MATPSADQKIEWDGDSLAELMSALQAAALPVRIEVIAPGAMGGNAGEVQLLAGGVADAFAGSLRRDDAVAALQRIEGARFLVETRLPDPESGSLGEPGPRAGKLKDRPLASLMRYCEDYVLTCELQIARGQERAMIGYRRGEIASTTVDGSDGEERLPEVLAWTDGSYEIVLPPPALPPSHRRDARPSDGAAKPEYRRRATLPMAPAPPAAPAPTIAQARPTQPSSTDSFEPAKPPPPTPAARVPAMPAPQRPAAPPSTRPSIPPPSSLRLPPPPAAKPSDARAAASAHPSEVPSGAFPPETTRRGIPAVPPAGGAPATVPKKDVPAAAEAKPAAPRPAGEARPQTLARHASPPTAGAAAAKPASPTAAPAKPASTAAAPPKPASPAAAPSRQAPAGAAAPAGKPAPATAVPRRPTPLSTQAPAPAPRQPTPPPASAHVSVKQPTPPPATAAAARARPIENPPIPPARPIKPSPAGPTSNDLKPASGTIQAKPKRSAPARPVAAPIEVLQERAAPPPPAHATPAVVAGHAARHRHPRSSARKRSDERPVRVYIFMGLAIGVGIVLAYWLYWALPFGH